MKNLFLAFVFLVLSACVPTAPTPQVIKETVIVPVTVQVPMTIAPTATLAPTRTSAGSFCFESVDVFDERAALLDGERRGEIVNFAEELVGEIGRRRSVTYQDAKDVGVDVEERGDEIAAFWRW